MAFFKFKNKLNIISVLQRAKSDQKSTHPFGYDGYLWLQVAALLGFDLSSSLYNMGNTKQSWDWSGAQFIQISPKHYASFGF